jgi:hypothetical protein
MRCLDISGDQIPKLLQATIEGYPIENAIIAMAQLRYLSEKYLKVINILQEKLEKINEETKKKIIYDAIYVLKVAYESFREIEKRVYKALNNNTVQAKVLLEEIEILKQEFREVNDALMELIRQRWWTW